MFDPSGKGVAPAGNRVRCQTTVLHPSETGWIQTCESGKCRSADSTAARSAGRSSSTISHTLAISTLSYSCRKKLPKTRNCSQGISGHRASPSSPSFRAASLIRSSQRSTASLVFRSCPNPPLSIPRVNASIRTIFARMSSKRCRGSLEGTKSFGFDRFLQARLQRSFLHEVDWLAE